MPRAPMRAAAPTVLAAATLALAGCATAGLRPPSSVVERAAVARSYSGRLRVTLRGPDLRGRARDARRRPAGRGVRGAAARRLPRDRRRRGAAAVGRAVSARVLRVPSFAKINLGLEVLGTRQDGYHELRTIFQTIDLKDDVELRPGGGDLAVSCDHPGVPQG